LTGSYGDRDTKGLGANGSASFGRFSLAGDVRYQGSDGFNYPDQASGARLPRANSDFERLNLTAKAYYTPSSSTEIMVNGGLYRSSYGMPPALFTQRARYWRFPKWDRSTLNAGGFTSLGRNSILRFRSFYVSYDNTLDWFADPAMTELDSSSTYDNSSYGGFALAELPTGGRNTLKTSLLYQRDVARIQDDAGLPWDRFDQGTLSAGVEDHLSLAGAWKIIGGLSLDSIDKYRGGANNTALNPLVGLKFTPNQDLDLHVSFARKSRFPSMRSLYSPSSGNPDLLAESGTAVEAAGTWNGPVFFTASVFFNKFRNFIDTVRNPDGTRTYYNVGRAHINGFEVQVQKATRRAAATANYTFLDHRNETDDRPLDAQPKHNLNLEAAVTPFSGVRLGLYGLYGSTSWWYDSSSRTVLTIPSFFSLDAVLGYTFRGRYEIFARLGNLFDDYFYTEPGFPWRGRYFELGFRADVLK
jgi:iron complex outermembrane receptor protein